MDNHQKAALLLMDLAESVADFPEIAKRCGGPGALLEHLPSEQRELLTHLRSDDLATVRWPPWR